MAGLGVLWGKQRRNDRGAAAVEFALVVPLLGMLLFGIITFGLGYSDKVALVNAVRREPVSAPPPTARTAAGPAAS